jgi:hypothetical protein
LTTGQEYLQSSYQEADSKRKEQQQIIKEINNELADYKKKSERLEKESQ